jgi:hypothetical protein
MPVRLLLSLTVLVAVAASLATTARGSCIASTPTELRARADVIFDGVALEGPTATGVQRFRVKRFVKGAGPPVVRVRTGTIRRPDGTGMTTSVSLFVKKGERWRIFAQGSSRKVVRTTLCDGSRPR